MAVIASSNNSLFCFTNTSIYPAVFRCFDYPVSSNIFFVFALVNLFFIPLSVLVLWLGYQRRKSEGSTTSGTTSHSDVFTYHMTAVDTISTLGSLFLCGAIYTCSLWMKSVGYYFLSFTYPGQSFFHCLACMERYLAVVHPVTYRSLRVVGGIKIRNISIGCVWLLCFGSLGLTTLYFPNFPSDTFFVIFAFTVFVVFFCSLSVLHVLIHLGLGKVGGEKIDKSKQRAFHTILAITGALALRSCGLMAFSTVFKLQDTSGRDGCIILMSGVWMCLPSNLVLPLLFLHKARKLSCLSSNPKKGQA